MPSSIAVLFDLDGVLVDSRRHHVSAWDQLAREQELAVEPGYFTRTFGLRNDAIIGGLVPGISSARLEQLARRKEELFREHARNDLALLPGVDSLLARLQAEHVPAAVVTSTPRQNLDMILDELRIRGRFQALVAEEDAAKGKPDPEGFLVAASRLRIEPSWCVVIEDAPAGLRAAKAAAMRAIGVTTTHPAADLGDAGLVVDSLAEEAVLAFILKNATVDAG